MYVCKDCKKKFKEKVDYCDCGNNEFEEIPDPPPVQVNNYPVENPEVFSPAPMLPVNIMSIVVFSLCCVFSLCFVLFFGPEPKKHSKAPVTHEKAVVKDIPTVDSFWDDTPAYVVSGSVNANADWELYKNGLRNTFLAMFDPRGLEGSGSCDIEFVLDRHGNLRKKKLYQNTANKPLVTAAKKMLSGVKGYNPPPAGYDGSAIMMEVRANADSTYSLMYKE